MRRVVDTRNYLTHRNDKRAALEDVQRFWHGQALGWLLRAYLLRDLGFSAEDVEERLRQNLRFATLSETMSSFG